MFTHPVLAGFAAEDAVELARTEACRLCQFLGGRNLARVSRRKVERALSTIRFWFQFQKGRKS
ncbi:hypothetical protein [Rhizobium tropici]|uniref:hypothetical protein n=1 Tax=Rhizobium tropici TaxID=398 RepID=UPI00165F584D